MSLLGEKILKQEWRGSKPGPFYNGITPACGGQRVLSMWSVYWDTFDPMDLWWDPFAVASNFLRRGESQDHGDRGYLYRAICLGGGLSCWGHSGISSWGKGISGPPGKESTPLSCFFFFPSVAPSGSPLSIVGLPCVFWETPIQSGWGMSLPGCLLLLGCGTGNVRPGLPPSIDGGILDVLPLWWSPSAGSWTGSPSS